MRIKLAMIAVVAALFGATAQAATIGNDLVDRDHSDGWSDFTIVFTDLVFGDGLLKSVGNFGGVSGDIAYLLISEDAGAFTVEATFGATALANEVSVLKGLSATVKSGWMLGLYQGVGKVDFGLQKDWSTAGSANFTSKETGQPGVGDEVSIFGTSARDYSISAEFDPGATGLQMPAVPLPASLTALVIGLAALGGLRRRRGAA